MIVIAGKNDIAVHGLEQAVRLYGRDNVIAIPNANDDGANGWQRSFKKCAVRHGVETLTLEEIYGRKIELFLSLEFDRIVNPARLSTDRIYNIHFSLLPKYKGMFTSVWPVLNGDNRSGVTLHEIDQGIDTGNIVSQQGFPLLRNDRSQDCYRKYIDFSKVLLDRNLHELLSDEKMVSERQPSFESTYHSKSAINFNSVEIDLKKTAWEVQRQIYAFSFRPYQLAKVNGKNVSEVIITGKKSIERPGTILAVYADRCLVATVDYDVELIFDDLDSVLTDLEKIKVSDLDSCIEKTLGVFDKNHKGWSLIIVAAHHGRIDLIERLLELGANVNDRNYNGTTVLMYAKDHDLKNNTNETVQYLIQNGAEVENQDHSGRSIFDYVSQEQARSLGL